MATVTLAGLAPTPLSNYLAAIGLFRVVAEQMDREARAAWVRDEFVMHGPSLDELTGFMLERYAPTPVFSPWNKEGDPTKNSTTSQQIDQITGSDDPRFSPYRSTLETWRIVASTRAWIDAEEVAKTAKEAKRTKLALWRSAAPDVALGWIDAAVAVSSDDIDFPPLLGSGGNDGRFEFSRLLHGEIIRLFIDQPQTTKTRDWLQSLLTGEPGPALIASTLGMYDGDAAGTPNSSPQGSAKAASNPWSIVLTFEGLVGFGASIASRAGTAQHQLVGAPFMVRTSGVGEDSSPDEDARGELWAPIWTEAAGWPELRRVIGEGRLSWQRRQAASTVDAARSVASLGVDRGITTFVRHQIVKRNGLSFIAAPAGRVTVREVRGAPDLGSIDAWVRSARRTPGAAVSSAARQLDKMLIAASATGEMTAFQEVLIALTELEAAIAASTSGREKVAPFPNRRGDDPRLDVAAWQELIDDDEPETRIAIGLASLRSSDHELPFAAAALAFRGVSGTLKAPRWPHDGSSRDPSAAAARSAGYRAAVEILRRRLLAADQVESPDPTETHRVGYTNGIPVPLPDVMQLIDGAVDIQRVIRLTRGFSLLDNWKGFAEQSVGDGSGDPEAVDAWFAAVKLCLLDRPGGSDDDRPFPLPRRRWGRSIEIGRFNEVGADALTALRRTSRTSLRHAAPPQNATPLAVAIALLVRLGRRDQRRLADTLTDPVPKGEQP